MRIGIDLGGTNIKVGIIDNQGNIIAKSSIPTIVKQGVDLIIKDISSYVSQSSGEFITGRVPLNDNTWNAYIQKIKSMGADRALELATKAYNRAKAVMSGN